METMSYYAKYNNSFWSVDFAKFNSEQERDAWVNFQDDFSKTFNVTAENTGLTRSVATPEEVKLYIGDMIYLKDYTEPDMWDSSIEWVSL